MPLCRQVSSWLPEKRAPLLYSDVPAARWKTPSTAPDPPRSPPRALCCCVEVFRSSSTDTPLGLLGYLRTHHSTMRRSLKPVWLHSTKRLSEYPLLLPVGAMVLCLTIAKPLISLNSATFSASLDHLRIEYCLPIAGSISTLPAHIMSQAAGRDRRLLAESGRW